VEVPASLPSCCTKHRCQTTVSLTKKGTTFFGHPHSVTVRRPLPLLACPVPTPLTHAPAAARSCAHPHHCRVSQPLSAKLSLADGDAICRWRRRRRRGGHAGPAPDPGRAQEARAGGALPRGAPGFLCLILAFHFINSAANLLRGSCCISERKIHFFPR
jgi:hypothetical protein